MQCWSAHLERGGSPQQDRRMGWPLSHMRWEQNNTRVCHSNLCRDTIWARSSRQSLQTLPGAAETANRLFVDQRPPSHTDICWRRKTSCLFPSPHTASGSLAIEMSYGSQDLKGVLCCPLHWLALLLVQKRLCFVKGCWVGATELRNGVNGKARDVEGVIQTEGASMRENMQKRGKRLKENSQQLTELCRGPEGISSTRSSCPHPLLHGFTVLHLGRTKVLSLIEFFLSCVTAGYATFWVTGFSLFYSSFQARLLSQKNPKKQQNPANKLCLIPISSLPPTTIKLEWSVNTSQGEGWKSVQR